MAKQTAPAKASSYKTTGVHLPVPLWKLLNMVAFGRARTTGGRTSVSALLVKIIEKNRRELELEPEKIMSNPTAAASISRRFEL